MPGDSNIEPTQEDLLAELEAGSSDSDFVARAADLRARIQVLSDKANKRPVIQTDRGQLEVEYTKKIGQRDWVRIKRNGVVVIEGFIANDVEKG